MLEMKRPNFLLIEMLLKLLLMLLMLKLQDLKEFLMVLKHKYQDYKIESMQSKQTVMLLMMNSVHSEINLPKSKKTTILFYKKLLPNKPLLIVKLLILPLFAIVLKISPMKLIY